MLKVVAKPIDVIAFFKKTGELNPLRFKINEADSNIVIKIDKIICKELEKFAGNKMIVYRCQSVINGIEKVYEIKYEIETCKWMLYKI